MAIHRHGLERYVVRVRVGAAANPSGKTVEISKTCNTRGQAERLEPQIRISIFKHGTWPPPPTPRTPTPFTSAQGTLVDALKEAWLFPAFPVRGWKAKKSGPALRDMARECIDHLGPMRLCADLTPDDIGRLVAIFRERGNKNVTIVRKLTALYRVLWHAERKGWIKDRSPLRPPEELRLNADAFE